MKIPEAARSLGVSMRQVEHWIEKDYLLVERRGEGKARELEPTEVAVLDLLVRLANAGLRLDAAAPLARALRADGAVSLPGGIRISVQQEKKEIRT